MTPDNLAAIGWHRLYSAALKSHAMAFGMATTGRGSRCRRALPTYARRMILRMWRNSGGWR